LAQPSISAQAARCRWPFAPCHSAPHKPYTGAERHSRRTLPDGAAPTGRPGQRKLAGVGLVGGEDGCPLVRGPRLRDHRHRHRHRHRRAEAGGLSFTARGVTVERVLTDNGSCYRSPPVAPAVPGPRDRAQTDPAVPTTGQRRGADALLRTPYRRRAFRRLYTSESLVQLLPITHWRIGRCRYYPRHPRLGVARRVVGRVDLENSSEDRGGCGSGPPNCPRAGRITVRLDAASRGDGGAGSRGCLAHGMFSRIGTRGARGPRAAE
jgi:hypothetical protein